MLAFHRERGIGPRRGRGWHNDEQYYVPTALPTPRTPTRSGISSAERGLHRPHVVAAGRASVGIGGRHRAASGNGAGGGRWYVVITNLTDVVSFAVQSNRCRLQLTEQEGPHLREVLERRERFHHCRCTRDDEGDEKAG
jgi:hypothetical protein